MAIVKSAMRAFRAFTLVTTLSVSALAAPAPMATAGTTIASAGGLQSHSPRASLRLDIGKTKAWVGQAIPVTLTAFFRDVEGVTLEGAPQLESKSLITSNLSQKPQQSNQVLDGQSTLTVTWKGTVTPSAPGTVQLSVSLPARLQYRDAPASIAMPDVDDDIFGNMGIDAFDPSAIFNQMQRRMRQMMERPLGNVRTQDIALKASTRTVDALALPTAGQPATFTGAVGHFDIKASLASARVQVNEPVTLRIEVDGSGDLDRVDLAGVASSESWKAYPTATLNQPATPDKRPTRKVFEQVLVPLRGGELTVPAVSFAAFDPTQEQYVTRETAPMKVHVEGVATVVSSPTVGAFATTIASPLASKALPKSQLIRRLIPTRWQLGLGAGTIVLLIFAAAAYRARGRHGGERLLNRRMRRAAAEGQVGQFFESARSLVQTHLAQTWAMDPDQVTSKAIRERLGPKGEPLVELIAADETLRFARGGLESSNLKHLCLDVERSLRAAS